MSVTAACDRCAKAVKEEEDHIACMGFCDQVYHLRCLNLNTPFVRILREKKSNLFWMCDECVKLMKCARFKNVVSSFGNVISTVIGNQLTGISELKDEIVKNNSHVAQLADIVNAATPNASRVNLGRPSKRRRDDMEIGIIQNKQITGTKIVGSNEKLAVAPPPKLFWVYLSRFHPSVKQDVVEKLVRDGLQRNEPIKVVSLVKKGSDLRSMNFISFKVGVPLELKEIALDPETWPQGIVFREFEDSQAKNGVWLPPATLAPPVPTPNGTPTGTPFGTPAPLVTPAPVTVQAPGTSTTLTIDNA